jgi:hypothetical protein
MTFNDIEGATNSTLFIRWMTVADLQAYVPFLKQTDPRACALVLNVFWRLNKADDPWPQSVPTVHKIGLHSIATYTNYMPGETLLPNLMTVLENHAHKFEDTVDAIGAGLLLGAWIHHPDFNARLLLA